MEPGGQVSGEEHDPVADPGHDAGRDLVEEQGDEVRYRQEQLDQQNQQNGQQA